MGLTQLTKLLAACCCLFVDRTAAQFSQDYIRNTQVQPNTFF
jgi:hypothetical protein